MAARAKALGGCKRGYERDLVTLKCKMSKATRICRKRGGKFYVRKTRSCTCNSDDIWSREEKKCVHPDTIKCEIGKELDYNRGQCKPTQESQDCVKHGALYFDDEITQSCICEEIHNYDSEKNACVEDPAYIAEKEKAAALAMKLEKEAVQAEADRLAKIAAEKEAAEKAAA